MTNTTTKPTESFADLFAESLAKQEMKQGEEIDRQPGYSSLRYEMKKLGKKDVANDE